MTFLPEVSSLLRPILIHTSVKLVTTPVHGCSSRRRYFNPHEREARDGLVPESGLYRRNFNPHEREARDYSFIPIANLVLILIHTSVKLVTKMEGAVKLLENILIHTSVKLVTRRAAAEQHGVEILIHTSVKLVTRCRRRGRTAR